MNRYLLDTHALLWFDTDPARLPPSTLALLREQAVPVFVSSISAWELGIKHGLGKLPSAGPLLADYYGSLARYGFAELLLSSAHGLHAGSWSHAHRDPFDRALASQALLEGLTLVSGDAVFGGFPGVSVRW